MQATFAQLRSSFRTLLKIPFYLTEFVSLFFFEFGCFGLLLSAQ